MVFEGRLGELSILRAEIILKVKIEMLAIHHRPDEADLSVGNLWQHADPRERR
jgi:hypothetical protein